MNNIPIPHSSTIAHAGIAVPPKIVETFMLFSYKRKKFHQYFTIFTYCNIPLLLSYDRVIFYVLLLFHR